MAAIHRQRDGDNEFGAVWREKYHRLGNTTRRRHHPHGGATENWL